MSCTVQNYNNCVSLSLYLSLTLSLSLPLSLCLSVCLSPSPALSLSLSIQQTEGFRKRWFTLDHRRLMYFKDPLVGHTLTHS